jgi:hypothetical protein
VTDHDYRRERELRLLVGTSGSREDARVLADFYEQHGQLSRAKLWRTERRINKRAGNAADLLVKDPKWRRKVMMWLLGHVTTQAHVASVFRSSPSWARALIREVEVRVCDAANEERHHPTMAATLRLQAVGALPAPYVRGAFVLGYPPPESWPTTSTKQPHR